MATWEYRKKKIVNAEQHAENHQPLTNQQNCSILKILQFSVKLELNKHPGVYSSYFSLNTSEIIWQMPDLLIVVTEL